MKLKQISILAMLVVLVLLVMACNTTSGTSSNTGQPPAPEEPAEEIVAQPTPAPDTKQAATFDLKPDGCDMVCVLGAYLGLND